MEQQPEERACHLSCGFPLSPGASAHSQEPSTRGFWAELPELELESQAEVWVAAQGTQRHLWCGKWGGTFLRWGSGTFLLGSGLLLLGMGKKGCMPGEQGSPMLAWDQSCAMESLCGGNLTSDTLSGVNYCVNSCLQQFQVTYVA